MRVLIVGAGIAGLTAALALERAGFEVTLMERSPRLRDAGYMIDFLGPGFDVAERLGLLPALAKIHRPFAHLSFVDEAGHVRAELPYARLRGQMFRGRHFNFMRGDLERVLFEAVDGKVRVLFGCSPVDLDPTGTMVKIRTSVGTYESFDLVVGADGFHSKVRDLAFLAGESSTIHLGSHTAAYVIPRSVKGLREDAFVSMSGAGFTCSAYPLGPERVATFFVHRAPGWLEDRSPEACRRELESVYRGRGWILDELLDAFPGDETVYFDDVAQVETLRWSDGRVVLVGDAAGCVSLLAGQGASLAVFGAYTLARELRTRPEDVSSALEAYEARARPVVEARQRAAARNASFFVPRTRWGALLRDQLTRTAAAQPVAWLLGRFLRGAHVALD
ncbi:MAG TPA: FAD-dependent oxidoreductase [Polyangia bacterium]|nr:FAD-dependent oxidoreductase [Polyangia bacterium]